MLCGAALCMDVIAMIDKPRSTTENMQKAAYKIVCSFYEHKDSSVCSSFVGRRFLVLGFDAGSW